MDPYARQDRLQLADEMFADLLGRTYSEQKQTLHRKRVEFLRAAYNEAKRRENASKDARGRWMCQECSQPITQRSQPQELEGVDENGNPMFLCGRCASAQRR